MYESGQSNCVSDAATSSALYERAFSVGLRVERDRIFWVLDKEGTVVIAFSGFLAEGKLLW